MDNSSVEKLYSAFSSLLNQRQFLGDYSLSRGMTLLQKGNYKEAVLDFKRAVANRPDNVDAFKYMAMAYSSMGKNNEAIDAYKQVIKLVPTSADAYVNLGNAYLQADRKGEAEQQYKRAMQLDPLNVVAPYTLGNLYVVQGKLDDAEGIFKKVLRMAPKDGNAHYALGMTYNKMERYQEAAKELETALSLKHDFPAAHYELGVAYSELGRKNEAQREVNVLKGMDLGLYSDLLSKSTKPQIGLHIDTLSTFNAFFGSGTPVWLLDGLDGDLSAPNASKQFTMVFQFTNQMDVASVSNPTNWSISKAQGGAAGYYANGITPDSDVAIAPTPNVVAYDPLFRQARVTFTVTQNADGSGTMDPSHLTFKFSGTDIEGRAMDPEGDQYNGYAKISF